jgi:serine phosphatase RsbU (regulator of sigma subunit)
MALINRIIHIPVLRAAGMVSPAPKSASGSGFTLSLRGKLFLGFIVFNLVMAPVLAVVTYRTVSRKYLDGFFEHKLSIARILTTAINGDVHEKLTSSESAASPEYRRYLDLISTVRKQEKDIRYIYTINYNRADGRLYYALDGNIPDYDTIWFETSEFAFDLFIDKNSRMKIEYDAVLYDKDFSIDTPTGTVRVGIQDDGKRCRMLINGTPMIIVVSKKPLCAMTPHGPVSTNEEVREGPVWVNGKSITLTVSFTSGGMPSSWPGSEFIESDDSVDFAKELIIKKQEYIERELYQSSYGGFYSVYAPIINSRGDGVGTLVVSVNSREVDQYRRAILVGSVILFLAALALSSILTLYLARLFTTPLSKLMDGVNALAEGDMNALVEIHSRDEIGRLAERFNEMAGRLKSASEEQKQLISEIRQLNEGLENRVTERTLTIQEQSDELNHQIMMARKIQMSLLPAKLPDTGSVTISFKYEPMMAVGGDFIDFRSSDRDLVLFICDVSGHGVPAAFLSAMVKMSLPSCYEAAGRTALAVDRLHESLRGKMGDHFISAVFCHIDHATGKMTCSNAGHPPIIIARSDGSIEHASAEGKIITESFPPCAAETVTLLKPGDKLILYTDGVTEARGGDLVMFGEEKLDQLVRRNSRQQAAGLCETIYQSVLAHVGTTEHEFEDDLTLLVAEYTG